SKSIHDSGQGVHPRIPKYHYYDRQGVNTLADIYDDVGCRQVGNTPEDTYDDVGCRQIQDTDDDPGFEDEPETSPGVSPMSGVEVTPSTRSSATSGLGSSSEHSIVATDHQGDPELYDEVCGDELVEAVNQKSLLMNKSMLLFSREIPDKAGKKMMSFREDINSALQDKTQDIARRLDSSSWKWLDQLFQKLLAAIRSVCGELGGRGPPSLRLSHTYGLYRDLAAHRIGSFPGATTRGHFTRLSGAGTSHRKGQEASCTILYPCPYSILAPQYRYSSISPSPGVPLAMQYSTKRSSVKSLAMKFETLSQGRGSTSELLKNTNNTISKKKTFLDHKPCILSSNNSQLHSSTPPPLSGPISGSIAYPEVRTPPSELLPKPHSQPFEMYLKVPIPVIRCHHPLPHPQRAHLDPPAPPHHPLFPPYLQPHPPLSTLPSRSSSRRNNFQPFLRVQEEPSENVYELLRGSMELDVYSKEPLYQFYEETSQEQDMFQLAREYICRELESGVEYKPVVPLATTRAVMQQRTLWSQIPEVQESQVLGSYAIYITGWT
ncbi:unnamed protein product, partial [Timema podura]|nr:unnamed protein product [Timema podura]